MLFISLGYISALPIIHGKRDFSRHKILHLRIYKVLHLSIYKVLHLSIYKVLHVCIYKALHLRIYKNMTSSYLTDGVLVNTAQLIYDIRIGKIFMTDNIDLTVNVQIFDMDHLQQTLFAFIDT